MTQSGLKRKFSPQSKRSSSLSFVEKLEERFDSKQVKLGEALQVFSVDYNLSEETFEEDSIRSRVEHLCTNDYNNYTLLKKLVDSEKRDFSFLNILLKFVTQKKAFQISRKSFVMENEHGDLKPSLAIKIFKKYHLILPQTYFESSDINRVFSQTKHGRRVLAKIADKVFKQEQNVFQSIKNVSSDITDCEVEDFVWKDHGTVAWVYQEKQLFFVHYTKFLVGNLNFDSLLADLKTSFCFALILFLKTNFNLTAAETQLPNQT